MFCFIRFPATSEICFSGQTPYWQIVVYFLLSLGLSFLVLLVLSMCIFRVVKVVKNTFYPLVPLPQHIQEVQKLHFLNFFSFKTQEVHHVCFQIILLSCFFNGISTSIRVYTSANLNVALYVLW